jgi:hypothetical protein
MLTAQGRLPRRAGDRVKNNMPGFWRTQAAESALRIAGVMLVARPPLRSVRVALPHTALALDSVGTLFNRSSNQIRFLPEM